MRVALAAIAEIETSSTICFSYNTTCSWCRDKQLLMCLLRLSLTHRHVAALVPGMTHQSHPERCSPISDGL